MATQHSRSAARIMVAPAVFLLLVWMLVPLTMTLWFSIHDYRPLRGIYECCVGFDNYVRFFNSSAFWDAVLTTLKMVGGILMITVVGGVLLAILLDQPIWGQGIVRILVIAPFFVMPTVAALVWKNMFMNPVNGLLAHLWQFFGAEPLSWLTEAPLFSIIIIVAWQWLPFATLILLTAIQSLDSEQLEAAGDGRRRSRSARFFYIVLPHLSRSITVVVLIQTIFLLSIFAEIFVTTDGGSGTATNLTYLVYQRVLTVRRRGRLGGRDLRDHPGQYRCHLPDAHGRQEPGCIAPDPAEDI